MWIISSLTTWPISPKAPWPRAATMNGTADLMSIWVSTGEHDETIPLQAVAITLHARCPQRPREAGTVRRLMGWSIRHKSGTGIISPYILLAYMRVDEFHYYGVA